MSLRERKLKSQRAEGDCSPQENPKVRAPQVATTSKAQFADCCRSLQAPRSPQPGSSTGRYEIESPIRGDYRPPRSPQPGSSTGRYGIESPTCRLLSETTGPQDLQNWELHGSLRNRKLNPPIVVGTHISPGTPTLRDRRVATNSRPTKHKHKHTTQTQC